MEVSFSAFSTIDDDDGVDTVADRCAGAVVIFDLYNKVYSFYGEKGKDGL